MSSETKKTKYDERSIVLDPGRAERFVDDDFFGGIVKDKKDKPVKGDKQEGVKP